MLPILGYTFACPEQFVLDCRVRVGLWLPSTGVRLTDLTGLEPRDVQDYCVRRSSSGTSAYSS